MRTLVFMALFLLLACSQPVRETTQDPGEVVTALGDNYMKACMKQDRKLMEPVLHRDFRVVVRIMGAPELNVVVRDSLLAKMGPELISEIPQNYRLSNVRVEGQKAFATLRASTESMIYESELSFVFTTSGQWQLLQDMTEITSK